MSGTHTDFPAYEIIVDKSLVYSYYPSVTNLAGSGGVIGQSSSWTANFFASTSFKLLVKIDSGGAVRSGD